MEHLKPDLENEIIKNGYKLVAGFDEVGRGAWAGPLVVAGVIFYPDIYFDLDAKNIIIQDSKLITEKKREEIFDKITPKLTWATGIVSNKEIDKHGLSWANQEAVFRAINNLAKKPDYLLIDMIKGFNPPQPHQKIIHGDQKIFSIALASILAKVTRDRLMRKYHKNYPEYDFHRHKGYGTAMHQKSLIQYGLSPLHRLSFAPIKAFF
jgi:ribonuclease HII